MARRRYLLFLAFAVTRAFLYWSAHWQVNLDNSFDLAIYEGWAHKLQDDHVAPYSGVPIEYPPGVLPFVVAPELIRGEEGSYREPFILTMMALDIAAFAGLFRAGLRRNRRSPPWFWIAGTTLLGPIIYLRLDLVPAAATIWLVERLSAGSWGGAAGWWAFGAVAKIYPGFLFPAGLAVAPSRKRFLLAAIAVAGLLLLPYVGSLPDLWRSVGSFHFQRGIHAESTWGLAFSISSRLQGYLVLELAYGAAHIGSTAGALAKLAGFTLALATVGFGAWVATRLPRGEPGPLTQLLFALLALLLAVGTVFSPQFVLWLIALGAGVLCFSPAVRWPILMVLPIAALTQYAFLRLAATVTVDYSVIIPLLLRNLLVFAVGVGALFALSWKMPSGRRIWERFRITRPG